MCIVKTDRTRVGYIDLEIASCNLLGIQQDLLPPRTKDVDLGLFPPNGEAYEEVHERGATTSHEGDILSPV